jgi:hypothetical protein
MERFNSALMSPGGTTQGLLLYHMGATANRPDQMAFALDYMRKLLKRRFASDSWPSPVARHYLEEISLSDLFGSGHRARRIGASR